MSKESELRPIHTIWYKLCIMYSINTKVGRIDEVTMKELEEQPDIKKHMQEIFTLKIDCD